MLRLYSIGCKLSSNINLRILIKEIMELVEEKTNKLYYDTILGQDMDNIKEIVSKIGNIIADRIAEEGKPLNIKNVNTDKRFKINEKVYYKQKAILTVPIIYNNNTIGVIQLINKINGSYFTKEDQDLLVAMCSHIAVSLSNAKLFNVLKKSLAEYMLSLASAIDAKDPYTNGHSLRVTDYSIKIGKDYGLSAEQLEKLELMALMHDVGKIGITELILNKKNPLNDEEFSIMKTHTRIGSSILEGISLMQELAIGAKFHHEKFDGTGYLEGLAGENIPLEARIIAVADAFDAITTDRPYKKGLSFGEAAREINRCSGTHFDPEIVTSFNNVVGSFSQQKTNIANKIT
jgi:HD-GYP domain-containing protein (c-di-GMP phosphodiesterase class II)